MAQEIKLPENELKEIQEAFFYFDRDGDGALNIAELDKAMLILGREVPHSQLLDWVNQYDIMGNGYLDLDGFVQLRIHFMTAVDDEDEMIEAFRFLDKGHTGTMTNQELRRTMKMHGNKLRDEELDVIRMMSI